MLNAHTAGGLLARSRLGLVGALLLCGGVLVAGCGGSAFSSTNAAPGTIQVSTAENFWGSIAAQLGGEKVAVSSIIVNPNTDPHSYEPTAGDACSTRWLQLFGLA